MSQIQTYRDVIDLWRTRAALARQLKVKEGVVRTWHSKDAIPERHFEAVADAARRCEFEGISYAVLSRLTPGAALTLSGGGSPAEAEAEEAI